jgi:hypothetical protein
MINTFNGSSLTKRDLLLFDESICKNDYIKHKPYPRQSWPIFETNKDLVDNEANTILVGGLREENSARHYACRAIFGYS